MSSRLSRIGHKRPVLVSYGVVVSSTKSVCGSTMLVFDT